MTSLFFSVDTKRADTKTDSVSHGILLKIAILIS